MGEAAAEPNTVTPANRAAELAASFAELRATAGSLEKAGRLDQYGKMRLLLIGKFLELLEIDRANGRVELVGYAQRDLANLIAAETARLKAIAEGKAQPVATPLRVKDDYPRVVGSHLEQKVCWPDGKVEIRPVFLFGFGPFEGARRDIEFLGAMGTNYTQTEIGPSHVRPEENVWRQECVDERKQFFARAQNSGVLVDFLLSPHYVPDWLFEKHPGWNVNLGGFLRVALNQLGVKQFYAEFTKKLLDSFTDSPNVWSVCVANEPVLMFTHGDPDVTRLWHEYLKQKFGTLEKLNEAWGTDYKDWGKIREYREPPRQPYAHDPELFDWMRFNDRRLADWLAWLADVAKQSRPEAQTHAKMMERAFSQYDLLQGVDVHEFGKIGTLNGKDGGANWLFNAMIRGVREAPILNTENHPLGDRDINDVPAGKVYSDLWIQALSGLAGSSAWAWERNDKDPNSCFVGLFQYRPGPTEEYIRAGLDIMRLMPDVVALMERRPVVAVLYSRTSMLRDPKSEHPLQLAFEMLLEANLPATVITEQMLADGELLKRFPQLKVIVLPRCQHIPDDAWSGLESFLKRGFHDGRGALCVGPRVGAHNEYAKSRETNLFQDTAVVVKSIPDTGGLIRALQSLGVSPEFRLIDAQTRQPVPDVIPLTARRDGKIVAAVVNKTEHTFTCSWLDAKGNVMKFRDDIPLQPTKAKTEFTVKPREVLCGTLGE
ncbi:MAG: beta-galactosidase [Phycisphaerae bacterium]|nr:beta-galactosidase [Phycisphaerae bacterium]